MMEVDGENECTTTTNNVKNSVSCSSPPQSPSAISSTSVPLDDDNQQGPQSPDGNENVVKSPERSSPSSHMMGNPSPRQSTPSPDAESPPASPDAGNECTSLANNVNNFSITCSNPQSQSPPPPQSPPASPPADSNHQSPPESPQIAADANDAPPDSPDNTGSGNENLEDPKSPDQGSNQSNGMMVMGSPTYIAEESQSCSSPPPQSPPPQSPPGSPSAIVVDDNHKGPQSPEGTGGENESMVQRNSPAEASNQEGQDPPESPSRSMESPTPGSPDGSENENVEEPNSPEGSNQSNGMIGTPISFAEESQSQSSPLPAPKPKKKPEKVVPKKDETDEVEEGEDLEDGEIMDEEEEEDDEMEVEEEVRVVETKKDAKSSRRESSSGKSSSSSSKSKEKEKAKLEKKSKKDQEKEFNSKEELDPVKRLLAEVREKDNLEKEEREKRRKDKKRPHKEEKIEKSKEKDSNSKKKKPRISEEEDEGEEFLFVRGASPGTGGNGENWDAMDVDRRGGGGKRRRDSEDGASPAGHRHRRGHEGSNSPTRNNNRVVERPKRPERREPKSDVICAYFMQGKCQKSADQCNFSHDAVPPRKMELCKFWMMECCAKKEKCIYLHNDFPCKYFHTGLVCRLADDCKFSHNPLSDVTKQVLLKHIETAPKEILGDFPRLNRTGALNLINKMEAKLKGLPYVEEENNENDMMNQGGGPPHHGYDRHGGGPPDRHGGGSDRYQDRHHHNNDRSRDNNNRGHFGGPGHHENSRGGRGGHDRGGGGRGIPPPDIHRGGGPVDNRDRRQSRWEQSQPTRVDQEKLKELMNEAGIAGFYKDTMEDSSHSSRPNQGPPQLPTPSNQPPMFPPQLQNMQPPLMGMLPSFLLSQAQQGMQQVNNPALANVLAQLQIPSTSIVPTQFPPPFDPGAPAETTSSANKDDGNKSPKTNSQPSESGIPDNLPKMQRELFERIQQQQKKNQNKVQTQAVVEPEEPEENWYSDDEEEDSKKKEKEDLKAEINDQISSVLNQIRQQSQQQQSASIKKEPESLKTFFGDTDLRSSAASTDFKDVDLRTSSALFKKINILPATEINGSISSHEPVVYKVFVVTGALEKPDYSSVRGNLTPQAILMDPRLGPRRKRSNSIPAPESPTLDMHSSLSDGLNQPMSILDATPVFDPRTMKAGGGGGGQLSGGRGLLDTPNPFDSNSMPGMNMHMNMNDFNNPFNRDPRASGNNAPTHNQPPQNPANAAQLAQNFAAVTALMQQQWPNGQPPIDPGSLFMLGLSGGFPFMPQAQGPQGSGSQSNPGMDFSMMQQNPHGMRMRPPFMPGNQQQQQSSSNHQQQAPPASSWERFNRGQGNLSPPL